VDLADVGAHDVVFGIAASGSTPYVKGALARARARGAKTVLLSCTDPPPELLATVDLAILPKVGPEALTGSTRLKAGTATKLVLNTVTTGAMIRWGKAYGNLMVDLRALSAKLHDRGERIVMEVWRRGPRGREAGDRRGQGPRQTAISDGKTAAWISPSRALPGAAGGLARKAVGEPPPPVRDPGTSAIRTPRAFLPSADVGLTWPLAARSPASRPRGPRRTLP